jgi:hypothetical protein
MIVTMAIVQSFALTSRLSSPLLSISLKESNTIRMQSSNINVNDLVKPVVDRIKPVVDRIKHRINPLIDKVKLSLTKIGWTKKVSKEDIAKLGLFTLLSYGWVSNVSYITCLIISWIIHGKEYGLSPLASGQWKSFLTIYAALWAANNVLRPFRVTFALFLAPYFEKWVDEVEKRSGFKRATSTGIVIFLFNICGTISYLVGGLFVATKLAGVPLLP